MNRFFTTKSVVLATLFFCFLVAGCDSSGKFPAKIVAFEGGIMGTTYHVSVVASLSDEEAQETAQAIEAALKHVDRKMSTYKDDSEVSGLNKGPGGIWLPVSDETFALLQVALEINRETDGAFDITVGPLVNAWGFGPDAFSDPPSEETMAGLRELIGPDKIALDALSNSVKKAAEGVYCDLSGIAKGYAVDVVAATLEALDLPAYMIEVGGEVRCAGLNSAGVPWNIAIEKPVSEGRVLQLIVGLERMGLATSGDYRNFYEVDGKRISHTIDPATGAPVDHQTASVSVLHPRCALADAYATAFMVMGPEKGLPLAERLGLPVMFVVHEAGGDFSTQQTESFKQFLVK